MRSAKERGLAVITFNDVPAINHTFKYDRLGRMALENRRRYCERHGYRFISDVSVARNRPSCWAKIPAILEAFETHPWVLWADSDTLIFDQAQRLEELCDPGYDMVVQSHEEFYRFLGIPIAQGLDRMPINTGVFLMRASAWSQTFLRRAYDQTQFVFPGEVWNGIGEQEAMIWLLRQNPADRLRIKYVEHLQNHPKFYRPGDRFVHFYGNHAPHLISLPECEETLRRWEAANRSAAPFPADIARFHWCCIQNIQPDALVVRGDVAHYMYSPEDIAPGPAGSFREPRFAGRDDINKRTEAGSREVAAPPYDEGAAAIYRDDYATVYPSLYITPWRNKHELNAKNLAALFQDLAAPMPDWLDLACGQAWHFSMFPGQARMVGLDLSGAQLTRARERVPHAIFVHEDMARVSFPISSFDLVTNFWAGYCYLGSRERIAAVLRKAVRWIRTGGALYIEVLLPRDLESFNRSHFAGQTGFAVRPHSKDYTDWQYNDVGGRHEMTSPPLEFFLDLLAPAFGAIEARHDSAFMVHLIATGRKHDP